MAGLSGGTITVEQANALLRQKISYGSLRVAGTNPHYVEGHTSKRDNPTWYRRGVTKNNHGKVAQGPALKAFIKQLGE